MLLLKLLEFLLVDTRFEDLSVGSLEGEEVLVEGADQLRVSGRGSSD